MSIRYQTYVVIILAYVAVIATVSLILLARGAQW